MSVRQYLRGPPVLNFFLPKHHFTLRPECHFTESARHHSLLQARSISKKSSKCTSGPAGNRARAQEATENLKPLFGGALAPDSHIHMSANHIRHRKHSEVKVEKKALLKLLRAKLIGDHTEAELEEPLEYNPRCKTSAVLVATSAIDINGIQVTKLASKVLADKVGLSLDALSHWALVVVDRGEGVCYLYDLMSDRAYFSSFYLLSSTDTFTSVFSPSSYPCMFCSLVLSLRIPPTYVFMALL